MKTKTQKTAPTKAAIAYKLLTKKRGTTRQAIVAACGGWNIDLKQFAERKGLRLSKNEDGVITARAA